MNDPLNLTYTHLRFDVLAHTPLKLGEHQAGERLRDALASVMLRAVCPENPHRQKPAPEHAAVCPACWLLAAETDAGEVRRAYSLVPPLPPVDIVPAGQRFSFVLTLFGQGFDFLPYFVLAVPAMGRTGIGPGRGQFELEAIWAISPLTLPRCAPPPSPGAVQPGEGGGWGVGEAVLLPGDNLVRYPESKTDWNAAEAAAAQLQPQLEQDGRLRLHFLTPTRLVDQEHLVKTPDFGVFFRRLLQRIDDLSRQHAQAERRPPDELQRLHTLADQVRLVEADVHWVDLWGPSSRHKQRTPMGGFTGKASYRSPHWENLLPYLLFGQGIQVGKLTVKGNGVYEVVLPGVKGYWSESVDSEQ